MTNDLPKLSEITFQLMVESSPNALVLVNKEGNIIYINNQTEKLFGYNRAELFGQNVTQLIPERFRKNHPGFVEQFIKFPSERVMGAGRELFAKRKDHSEVPIEIGLNPIYTSGGMLVLASIIDISERKKAEERFKLVVESAPNAMILVNHSGEITLVNNQVEQLFGYNRKELIGNKLEILIPERFRSKHPDHRTMFFKQPEMRNMGSGRDLFGLRKDGTEVQVEIGLNPIETPEGNMVLASIIDITERKLQEQSIKKQIELESKNKELEQFAYIASHDLQAPLRTISNYIGIFEEDYASKLDENAQDYLKRVYQALERMNALIKALLDFSRLGRNMRLNNVDCGKIITEVLDDLNQNINDTSTCIEIGEMPVLYVCEIEMRQLFQNLISNAIKFRKKNESPVIKINAEQQNDKWKFSISDNGIGIDPIHFERIFLIFQRLNHAQQYEGYGIGLANCKRIVELHKGEISVESELGKGSTFYFTISNLAK